MAEQNPTPVMEVAVASPFGFQPQVVEDQGDSTQPEPPAPEPVVGGEDTPPTPESFTSEPPPEESDESFSPFQSPEQAPSSPQSEEQRTNASILALGFVERGALPPNLEIPPDLTADQLIQVLDRYKTDVIAQNIQQDYLQRYGEDKLKYLDYLLEGGDPNDIRQLGELHKLKIDGDDPEHLNNRKALIMEMYKAQGLKENRIEQLYNDILDSGEDKEEAETARKFFDERFKQRSEDLRRRHLAEQQRQQEAVEAMNSRIVETIRSRKIDNMELTPQQSQALESYMFQPVAVINVPQEDGSTIPHRVSQYYKDYQKFHEKTENLVKLARFIQMGGNMSLDEEVSQLKTNDTLLDQLNQVTTGERSTKNAKNAYYNFGTS